MTELGYKSCLADPDIWLHPNVRESDGHKYYEYVLIYVDDIMCVSHQPQAVLSRVDKFFPMNPGSIREPDYYLGAKVSKVKLPNTVTAWAQSPSKYVREAVKNLEEYLEREHNGQKLGKKRSTPMSPSCWPELNVTPELDVESDNYYQLQIGVLQWAAELGRLDIMMEVSMLSSHLVLPQEGCMEAIYDIFAYLKIKHTSRMVFDPLYLDIDMNHFKECDWKPFYDDVKEVIPENALTPRGKDIDLHLYVDADHAGDKITRQSWTGYFIFLNSALVDWYSKRQSTIESSVFGSKCVALKAGMEKSRGLRYKL
jgi:deoxycytidine triphosphate deaminase